jgi:hypothetical protein
MGIGTKTCAEFVEHCRANPVAEDVYFEWAQGFMSAINDALEDTAGKYRDLNSLPLTQQKQLLRAFCNKNATAGYKDAIGYLLSRLTWVPTTLPNAPLYPPRR